MALTNQIAKNTRPFSNHNAKGNEKKKKRKHRKKVGHNSDLPSTIPHCLPKNMVRMNTRKKDGSINIISGND